MQKNRPHAASDKAAKIIITVREFRVFFQLSHLAIISNEGQAIVYNDYNSVYSTEGRTLRPELELRSDGK